MSFECTDNFPNDPLLTVELSGLLVLRPDKDHTQCQVGVHNRAQGHTLTINLLIYNDGEIPTILPLHSGPLDSDFIITARGKKPCVRSYHKECPVDPDEPVDPTHLPKTDFRFALPIGKLHPKGYSIDNRGLTPRVVINNGIFYSRRTTDTPSEKYDRAPGRSGEIPNWVAADIGVAIDPDLEKPLDPNKPDSTILLEWSVSGQNYCLKLPLPAPTNAPGDKQDQEKKTRYVLAIINDPMPPQPPHDELKYYYNVIRDKNGNCFPPSQQHKLKPKDSSLEDCDSPSVRNTLDIPCMPIVDDGPHN